MAFVKVKGLKLRYAWWQLAQTFRQRDQIASQISFELRKMVSDSLSGIFCKSLQASLELCNTILLAMSLKMCTFTQNVC